MKFTKSQIGTILITVLLSSGCATSGGKKFDVASVDKIKIGQTTTRDTIMALGEPYARNITADGTERWRYEMRKTKTSPTAKAFVPFFGSYLQDSQRTKMASQNLELEFSSNLLSKCKLTVKSSTGSGIAMAAGGITDAMNSGTTQEVACGE